MASHVLMRPQRAGRATFTEGSLRRAGLSSVYNVYSWAPPGPPEDDDALVVLRPVFWLSFTLDDYLAQRPQPDQSVIVTSASSKAALGLAHLLARRGVPVTGLTSASRVAFVDRLDAYGQVLSYDQVGSLPVGPVTLVDIAGGAALRDEIGRHLCHRGEVVIAGGTHGEAEPLAAGAFSAPQRIQDLAGQWGWPALEQRYQEALQGFAAGAAAWLDIRRHRGLAGAEHVYREVLTGASPPAAADIVDLTPQQVSDESSQG